MTKVAESMASTSPDRAEELLRDAERTAARLSSTSRDEALASIAVAWRELDPRRGANIAMSITNPGTCAETLAAIAVPRVAGSAGDKRGLLMAAADRARQVTDLKKQAQLMTEVGARLAAYDADEARRIIDHAEVIARTVPGSFWIDVRAGVMEHMEAYAKLSLKK